MGVPGVENVDLLGQLLSTLQWPGVILAFAGLCLAVVRAVNAAFELSPDEGLRCEALLEQGLFVDGEAAEGIRAFMAKRVPDFA